MSERAQPNSSGHSGVKVSPPSPHDALVTLRAGGIAPRKAKLPENERASAVTARTYVHPALGGKVIGAGGGGFLMFYCENKTKLRHAMARANRGDLLVVCVDKHAQVMDELETWGDQAQAGAGVNPDAPAADPDYNPPAAE